MKYKIIIDYDTVTKLVDVKLTPKNFKKKDVPGLLTTLLGGVHVGLQALFAEVPIMRPATEIEKDNQVYIFAKEKDNDLYKGRANLYKVVSEDLNATLDLVFPDIRYIDDTIKHQQELVFNMSAEEAEEHRLHVAKVSEYVKENL